MIFYWKSQEHYLKTIVFYEKTKFYRKTKNKYVGKVQTTQFFYSIKTLK